MPQPLIEGYFLVLKKGRRSIMTVLISLGECHISWLSLYVRKAITTAYVRSPKPHSSKLLNLCPSPPARNVVCVHLVKVTKSNFLKYHFRERTSLYHLNSWFSISEVFGLDYKAMCGYGLLMPVLGVMERTDMYTYICFRVYNCVKWQL